jgi:cytochrome c556
LVGLRKIIMKHLFILTAVAIGAAFGWNHLYNISLETEQSRLNRSLVDVSKTEKPQISALVDPYIPKKVVLQRQAVMKGFERRLKSMNELTKVGDERRTLIANMAGEIIAEAQNLAALFPEATSYNDLRDAGTRARPEIWIENYKFKASVDQLVAETERLKQEAEGHGDMAAVARQLVSVGRNGCLTCHLNFRRPD